MCANVYLYMGLVFVCVTFLFGSVSCLAVVSFSDLVVFVLPY